MPRVIAVLDRRSLIAAMVGAVAVFGIATLPAHGGAGKAEVGQTAPDFVGATAAGGTISLADYRGKTVVLEWTNHDCPYVRKHYGADNMQALQKEAADEGVVWITVISSAPKKQGHVSGAEALEIAARTGASPTEIVLDPEGTIGRLYGARTTPHMYIVNAAGALVYKGGIDDTPTANPADIQTSTNYVRAALDEMASGAPISNPVTRAYGCSVKYERI